MKPPRARHKEWEPSAALTNALKGLSLVPGAALDGDVASLKSHLEEDFRVLERLKRLRSLSKREKARKETLKTLLALIERAE